MKYTKQNTRKTSPKILEGVLIQDFITPKKIGISYLSFLSFRLNAENIIDVEKKSHSPPKIAINRIWVFT